MKSCLIINDRLGQIEQQLPSYLPWVPAADMLAVNTTHFFQL
jgi:hypothetical protein